MSFSRYLDTREFDFPGLGEIPNHWELVRLRHIAELNPSKSDVADLPPDLPVTFLPMEAIKEDGTLVRKQSKPLESVRNGYTFFRENDVAIAKITPCFENGKGAVMRGLLNGIGFGTTELIVLRPKEGRTTSDYLHWLFVSSYFRHTGESSMYGAGGQKRVPDDFVRNFSIPLPPLPEQRAIATFLDRETAKIDALVAEQRRLIALLKEKRQAVISHAVTKGLNPDAPMKDSGIEWLGEVPEHWEVKQLRRIGRVQNGLNIGGEAFGSGDPFVSYGDVYNNRNVPEPPSGLVQSTADDQAKYRLEVGDVLFTRTSETVDDIGIASTCLRAMPRSTFAGFLIRFRPTEGVLNPKYSTHLFRNEGIQRHFTGTMNLVTRASLSQDLLKTLPVCIPPVEEQGAIAAYIDERVQEFTQFQAEAERAIALLQERRTALISAAVTGKIDVREYALQETA